jgi:uncharacterized protein
MATELLPLFFGNKFIVIYLWQQNYCEVENEWKHPDTITGDAATDGRYLRRDYINDEFWREVRKGNHILFVAPRRVGKTSVMKDLASNCPEGFVCIYEDIEGVRSRADFYKRLFELILHCAHRSKLKEAKAFIANCLAKYRIQEISKSGIKLDVKDLDYEKEVRNLIPELKNAEVHAVIFLDEFAEVINKLKKNDQVQDAIDILHTLREIRSDEDFRHFTVVYAGSIGLEFVIKNIDRPKLINDLHPIKLIALTDEEGSRLIRQLTKKATIFFSEEVVTYLKTKIEYLLPYYLQLMVEAIDEICFKSNETQVANETVDAAFQRILKERKNFEDWLERLKDYQKDYFPFINDLLKYAAHKGEIPVQVVYDKANRYGRVEDYMDFVEELIHDGYLMESETHVYRFISPLLRQFWIQKYPIYEG